MNDGVFLPPLLTYQAFLQFLCSFYEVFWWVMMHGCFPWKLDRLIMKRKTTPQET